MRALWLEGYERVELAVEPSDPFETGVEQLNRLELSRADPIRELVRISCPKFFGHDLSV